MAIGLPPRPAARRGPPGPDRRSLLTVDRYRKLRRNCYVITPVRFSRQNNSSAGITRTLETVGTALAQKVSECVRKCRRYRSDSPNLRKFPECSNGVAERSLRPPSPLRRRMYIPERRNAGLRLTSLPQLRDREKMFIAEKIITTLPAGSFPRLFPIPARNFHLTCFHASLPTPRNFCKYDEQRSKYRGAALIAIDSGTLPPTHMKSDRNRPSPM